MQNTADKSKSSINVLLIGSSPEENDVYSDLIREVSDCKIDVMSRVDSSFDWVAQSSYHVILVDLEGLEVGTRESRTNGLNLLEKIKRLSPAMTVILISDQATVEEAVAAIRMGAEDYFRKPINLEAFKLAVRRCVDKHHIFGESDSATGYFNLMNSCQMISSTMDQNKVLNIVKSYFTQELGSNFSALYILKNNEAVRMDEGQEEKKRDQAMDEILDIAIYASNPFQRMVESQEIYRFIERGQLTPGLFIYRFAGLDKKDHFCVCLTPKKPNAMAAFEGRLHMLGRQLEATFTNIGNYMGVQELVYKDDATGLYNTRYLNYILDREIAKANSTQLSFAVLFVDADRFKSVNDQHGHLVGTQLLNELGMHLKKCVRDDDTVFRYGGDEFVAVLTQCDLEMATMVAERIRESVEKKSFIKGDGLNIHFTVSIGVALYPDHTSSRKEVIEMADKAMYDAKKKSRNSVVVFPVINKIRKFPAPKAPLKGKISRRPGHLKS